jgi:peptidoglycan/xylan/chitin deacetylase (PgdA/CDA1 family)
VIPPILSWHKVDPRRELGFTRVGPRAFARQIAALARAGYAPLDSAGLLARLRAPSGRRAADVVLAFDDGYAALADHAFPVLADHGFRALVFVITDYVGRDNSWDVQYGGRRFAHLDWDALGRWQERGIEVHAHTATHARLTWLSDAEVEDELGRARATIAARLGRAPAGICYPFGSADERVRRLAAAAGYTLGFTGPRRLAVGDPLLLPRLMVYAWDRFAPPQVLRPGLLGALARWGARTTNRIAVGTALFQRALGRRYR